MTDKEQTEMAREFTKAVKNANTSREIKEHIYSGFVSGLEKVEGYSDRNLMEFCRVLDDVIRRRRGVKK